MIGVAVDVRIAQGGQVRGLADGGQRDGRLEHGDAGALAADQRARHVEVLPGRSWGRI